MRNFLKVILFLAVGTVIFLSIEMFFFKPSPIGKKIYKVLSLSRKKTNCDEIIIGDSVCRQLFAPGKRGKRQQLAANQAVSMVGHYILVANYIKSNPGRLKKVTLVSVPMVLRNNLDQPWTFNYFFLPFYTKRYDVYFSPLVLSQLKRNKYHFVQKLPLVKRFVRKHPDMFPVNYSLLTRPPFRFQGYLEQDSYYLSPISLEYLGKLRRLCREQGVDFRVVCPPLRKKFAVDYTFMKIQLRENGLDDLFQDYFAGMISLDDTAFADHVHFTAHYLKRNRSLIKKRMGINKSALPLPPLERYRPLPDPFKHITGRGPDFIDPFEQWGPKEWGAGRVRRIWVGASGRGVTISRSRVSPGVKRLKVTNSPGKGGRVDGDAGGAGSGFRLLYRVRNAHRVGSVFKAGTRIYFSVFLRGRFGNNPKNRIFLREAGNSLVESKIFASRQWYEYRVHLRLKGGEKPSGINAVLNYSADSEGGYLEIKEPKIFIIENP